MSSDGVTFVSEVYSSRTVKRAGQPTIHEAREEFQHSSGNAHGKHVRQVGDKKHTTEWTREGKDGAKELKNTIENAKEDEFEQAWKEHAPGAGAAKAIENK